MAGSQPFALDDSLEKSLRYVTGSLIDLNFLALSLLKTLRVLKLRNYNFYSVTEGEFIPGLWHFWEDLTWAQFIIVYELSTWFISSLRYSIIENFHQSNSVHAHLIHVLQINFPFPQKGKFDFIENVSQFMNCTFSTKLNPFSFEWSMVNGKPDEANRIKSS